MRKPKACSRRVFTGNNVKYFKPMHYSVNGWNNRSEAATGNNYDYYSYNGIKTVAVSSTRSLQQLFVYSYSGKQK